MLPGGGQEQFRPPWSVHPSQSLTRLLREAPNRPALTFPSRETSTRGAWSLAAFVSLQGDSR